MKEVSADFVRGEVARLGELVVETAVFHPSGMKLFSAGDALTFAHAKALHASGIRSLHLLEFDEDLRVVRKTLGVERVSPKEVAAGDVLMDDLRGAAEELVFAAGTPVNDSNLDRIRNAAFAEVVIRDRRLSESMREAQEFFAQLAPPDEKGATGTRVKRVIHAAASLARYLLIPRAHALVAVSDDPLRIFVSNALQSEGHAVVERPSPADVVEVAQRERNVTVIVLDLDEAPAVLPKLRAEPGIRDAAILVCAKEGKHAMLHAALMAGANDGLPSPPSRDQLSEKIHGCLALLGRRVKLAPSLRSERRRLERRPGGGECRLKDPTQTKPLPVLSGEILDSGDGGLRIDYNLPTWPSPWAYTVHGVHPRHFFYTYALANPLGRDLIATLPGGVERPVRVAAVSPSSELEALNLVFPEVKERASTGTSVRKKF